jgi:deoxyribodipyrimidine photo-lyase
MIAEDVFPADRERMMRLKSDVPIDRIQTMNDAEPRAEGSWVVYWMVAQRRTSFNFALQRAADWARHLGRPLLVFEPLRIDYPWASARLHRFIIDGMAANLEALGDPNVTYYPYIEPEQGHGRGLLSALADRACLVVTDHFPTFFLPRMVEKVAARLEVMLEAVDSHGLIPLAATEREMPTAYSFRRFLQKHLLDHLQDLPLEDPLLDLPPAITVPAGITKRWPPASQEQLCGETGMFSRLAIDQSVAVVPTRGGAAAGRAALGDFLGNDFEGYVSQRNRPDADATSGLSPYLHFGHLSSHQIFLEIATRERWSPEQVVPPANGRRSGWWDMSESAEAFLDQCITWRELGFHFCHHRRDHDRYESLPEWAQKTLAKHAGDPREHTYSLGEFDGAATHDQLWNAAQNQLRREGRLHNYLRMLWGKKILELSSEPREALEIMIELNNRYALDGRDPNSYSGIFWVLGRHDRAWGPERPVFGTVRYMSSKNTARKVPVKDYMEKYS